MGFPRVSAVATRANKASGFIYTHPYSAARRQDLLNRLYALGIRAIWNFAPVDLQVPRDMVVVNVHLSDSLHILSYQIKNRDE